MDKSTQSSMKKVLGVVSNILIVVGLLTIAYFWLSFAVDLAQETYSSQLWSYVIGISVGVTLMPLAILLGPIMVSFVTTVSIWMWIGWIAILLGFALETIKQ